MTNKKKPKIIAKPLAATQKQASSVSGGKKEFPLHLILALLLGLISFLVYANTIKNGFALDDFHSVKDNVYVNKGVSAIPSIFATPYLREVDNDFYRPLSLVSFAIEKSLWGINPGAQHLVNIILFAICVTALFFFLDDMFGGKKTAVIFMACLLFACHPIHTEVVANIKSRDEILCFLFAFLSLGMFLKYEQRGKIQHFILGCATLLLSYLSKETVVVLLGIVPLVFFFYRKENRKRSIYISIGTVAITVLFLFIRHAVLSKYNANNYAHTPFVMNPLADPHISFSSRPSYRVVHIRLLCPLAFNTLSADL